MERIYYRHHFAKKTNCVPSVVSLWHKRKDDISIETDPDIEWRTLPTGLMATAPNCSSFPISSLTWLSEWPGPTDGLHSSHLSSVSPSVLLCWNDSGKCTKICFNYGGFIKSHQIWGKIGNICGVPLWHQGVFHNSIDTLSLSTVQLHKTIQKIKIFIKHRNSFFKTVSFRLFQCSLTVLDSQMSDDVFVILMSTRLS